MPAADRSVNKFAPRDLRSLWTANHRPATARREPNSHHAPPMSLDDHAAASAAPATGGKIGNIPCHRKKAEMAMKQAPSNWRRTRLDERLKAATPTRATST